jgi:hypothetical protein
MAARRRPAAVVVPALAVVLAAVAVGGVLIWRANNSGDDETAAPIEALIPPTGTPALIDPSRIMVEASSALEPNGNLTYGPRNTLDSDLETAWNSDTDDPVGQTLTYRFAEPVELTALQFVNGYAKSDEIFAANHRLRSVLVTTDRTSHSLSLLDTDDPQEISFDFGLTSKVELEVVEVFVGQGFNDPEITSDLALTEIAFVAVQPG